MTKKNLTLNQKKKLKTQGYIIIKNLISKKKIKLLILDMIKLFLNEMGLKSINPSIKLMDKKDFHKKLIDFRKKEPEKFSIVYNIIKGNSSLISILNDKKILNYACEILETDIASIWNGEFQLRMDTPFDKRNNLDWHQDASYYKEKTNDGSNGLVMWIAISKYINKRHGAINVCPGSHKEGVLSSKNVVSKLKKFKKSLKTLSRKIDNRFVSKYNSEVIESNRGDLIIMDLRTFHKSGYNKSKYIRFSTLNRVFNTKSKAWPRNQSL